MWPIYILLAIYDAIGGQVDEQYLSPWRGLEFLLLIRIDPKGAQI